MDGRLTHLQVFYSKPPIVFKYLVFGKHFHNRLHHMWIKKLCLFSSFGWRLCQDQKFWVFIFFFKIFYKKFNLLCITVTSRNTYSTLFVFLKWCFTLSCLGKSLITDGLSTMAFSDCILNDKISLDNVSWS